MFPKLFSSQSGRLALVAPLLLFAGGMNAGQAPEASTTSQDNAIAATLPLGASDLPSGSGFWERTWDGSKAIWNKGSNDIYLSGLIWHAPYHYDSDRRSELNEAAWGGGFGRTLTDERDNQRSFYAMATQDSHFKPQYMAGYTWMARWPVADSGVKLGAGYTAFLISREDYGSYVPFPAALPLLSAGTDKFAVFGTYVPFSDVGFFFARFSFR